MKVRRFEARDVDAIARLNARLSAGGAHDVVYPEGAEQRAGPIRERLFVADDGDEIRGGVWLKEHEFRANGADVTCGWLKYPVAESLVDPTFNGVPGGLLINCLREQPRLMALGLGGHETPLARMLARLKWTGDTVPLMVKLVRPGRALRQLAPLRRSSARRAAATAAAVTGAAWLGLKAFEAGRRIGSGARTRGYAGVREREFGAWADDVWTRARDDFGFLAARDSRMLNTALPVRHADTICLRVERNGVTAGWSCLVRHDFSAGTPDANFGTLTVGLIADLLAPHAELPGVLDASIEALSDSGVDLIFTNQLDPMLIDACRARAFVPGPSNFAFYRAPAAQALIAAGGAKVMHIDRGDCDGPIWYGAR